MLRTPFSWTDQNVDILRQMLAGGHSASEIAARLNCSRNAVIGKSHRIKMRLDGSRGRYPVDGNAKKVNWTPEMIQRAANLWAQGKLTYEIAAVIGCTPYSMESLINRRRDSFPKRSKENRVHVQSVAKAAKQAKAQHPEPCFPPKSFNADSVPFLLPEFPGATILAVRDDQCKFPVSNDQGEDMLCCGAPRLKGSYCGVHAVVSRGRGTESERKATSVGRAW